MIVHTEQEAADILKISVRTLQRWRQEGQGPRYTRLGSRRLGYQEAHLQEFANAGTYTSRAAELAHQIAA